MKAVGINGSIRKLQKWVIEGCWNIVQSNIKKKPSNVVIANKITKKVTKKIKSYDISGNYNLGLSQEDKAIKINKIQNNYTPQYVQNISGSIPTYSPVNTISGPLNNNYDDYDIDYDVEDSDDDDDDYE